jgi:hypothetical protein
MKSLVLLTFVIVILLLFCMTRSKRDNFTTGYAVTSGLAFNNRMSYCQPGNEAEGGDFSGGCFLPHRVIV